MALNNFSVFRGNLTKDPEGKTVSVGGEDTRVLNFSIAVNGRRGKEKTTVFVDLVAWGKKAELIEEHVQKGDQVAVKGEYAVDVYPDKETGKNVYRSKFTLLEVDFIKLKKWAEADAAGGEDAKPARSGKPSRRPEPEPEPEGEGDEDGDDSIPF